jgi:hypothetical protein
VACEFDCEASLIDVECDPGRAGSRAIDIVEGREVPGVETSKLCEAATGIGRNDPDTPDEGNMA